MTMTAVATTTLRRTAAYALETGRQLRPALARAVAVEPRSRGRHVARAARWRRAARYGRAPVALASWAADETGRRRLRDAAAERRSAIVTAVSTLPAGLLLVAVLLSALLSGCASVPQEPARPTATATADDFVSSWPTWSRIEPMSPCDPARHGKGQDRAGRWYWCTLGDTSNDGDAVFRWRRNGDR